MIAIDAGTTGVRSVRRRRPTGCPRASSYREFPQHFPQPGWVEHDADDIWRVTLETLGEVAARARRRGRDRRRDRHHEPARDGRRLGPRAPARPRHRAIVWQDRRTAARCDALRDAGHEPLIRRTTGLVLDPYFSATKLAWLLHEGGVDADADLAFGTVDTWILWNLTGGTDGGVHATDPSNASRTMLYDIGARDWSDELCALFDVPRACLPAVAAVERALRRHPRRRRAAGLAVPVSGIAGDQQAALFGQACVEPGHDEEHLRHRLVRAHQRRADSCPNRSTVCSRRSRGRSATTTSRTRWKARSSSPARRSSGCATGSA